MTASAGSMPSAPSPARRLTEEHQRLAAQWSGLPRKLARQATRRDDLADILESDGQMALCKAATTWNPAFGVRFGTYAFRAVQRAVATGLARELRREKRLGGMKEPGRVPDWREDHTAADGTLFGSLQRAVDRLPEGQQRALRETFAGGKVGSSPRELQAALAVLRADVVPSAVGEGEVELKKRGTPWSAEESAWLWRFLQDADGDDVDEHSSRMHKAARLLGRSLKSVVRRIARMRAAGQL